MLVRVILHALYLVYSVRYQIGATLANSNSSEEAIPYYEKALAIRPTYTRGWLNLGISYANLNRYEDAARAYLQALNLNPKARLVSAFFRLSFLLVLIHQAYLGLSSNYSEFHG